MTAAVLGWLLVFGAFQGGDPFEEGVRLYKAAKYAEALEAFTRAEGEAGIKAPPELYYNQALAALAAGETTRAATAAERAAARDPKRFTRLRDFVLGNAAFARCEALEKDLDASGGLPQGPQGPLAPMTSVKTPLPEAFDPAIRLAESARDAWIAAARGAEDWPAARRNAERAIVKIEELQKKKEEARKRKKEQEKQDSEDKKDQDENREKGTESRPESRPNESPSPESRPEEGAESQPSPQEKPEPKEGKGEEPKPEPRELSEEQIQRMLDKLDEKEKQRMQLQRARLRSIRVPKDW